MSDKKNGNNMMHYGDQVIMKEGQIASASVKETIRKVDAEEEEDEKIKQKVKERADLFDKNARVSIKKIQMTASAMKFYCGCNNFKERGNKSNNGAS